MEGQRTIHDYIWDAGLRRGYFADKIGVTPATVIKWNNKETRPSKAKIKLICELFDIEESDLDIKERKQ